MPFGGLPGPYGSLMELVYGAGKIDRPVRDAERLVHDWRVKERDWGQLYLAYEPSTPMDRVLVEDLAVTMLVNSRVTAQAAMSLHANGASLDLSALPDKALEETSDEERFLVATLIGTMTNPPWVGFGASVATKTLHKKRPALIPILDNRAIFGAYMNSAWPEKPSLDVTIKAVPRIKEALDWIAIDVSRSENESVWAHLQAVEPDRSRIELFDMVWWMYFCEVEPAGLPPTVFVGTGQMLDGLLTKNDLSENDTSALALEAQHETRLKNR